MTCLCRRGSQISMATLDLLQGYEEAGTDIAQLLTKKDTITKQKAAMSPAVAKALAKLANGLYVVTAAHSAQVNCCWLTRHGLCDGPSCFALILVLGISGTMTAAGSMRLAGIGSMRQQCCPVIISPPSATCSQPWWLRRSRVA